MATLVQKNKSQSGFGFTTASVAFIGAVAAGNLIALMVGTDGAAAHPTPTDTLGNTYTQVFAAGPFGGSSLRLSMWYAKNIAGGACTVSVAYGGTQFGHASMTVHELSGLDKVAPLDKFSSATGTSTAPASGSVTTVESLEYLFGGWTMGGAGTPSAGVGWTAQESDVSSGANNGFLVEDQDNKVPGSYTATGSLTASGDWVAGVATFAFAHPAAGQLSIVGASPILPINNVPVAGLASISPNSPLVVLNPTTPSAAALSDAGQTVYVSTGLMLALGILNPVRAPLIVQFDIAAVATVLDALAVSLSVGDWIDTGLSVTFDILPSSLTSLRTAPDVQAPAARVTLT